MEALGAIVQAIAFPELYLALSQKVVDGEENPIVVIYLQQVLRGAEAPGDHPPCLTT